LKIACDTVVDTLKDDLAQLASLGKDKLDALKKRKMISPTSTTVYHVVKSETFSSSFTKAVSEITAEMIRTGEWKTTTFKPFNFKDASGTPNEGGHLHPLNKVITEIDASCCIWVSRR